MSPEDFLARYAAAFASGEPATVATFFADPVHVVGETGGDPDVTCVERDDWLRILDRLVGAYRRLGVVRAELRSLEVSRLGDGVQVPAVAWALAREDGSPIYDFEATYTLVASLDGPRITAIAHNETPKLMAALGDEAR